MRKLLKIVISLFCIIFLVILILNVKIKNVDIVGNEKVSDVEIARHIFENNYDNISLIFYFKDKFGSKKKIPLVSKYDVEWLTPFSIIIRVTENPIIGFIRRDIKNVYFDKNGNICEVSDKRKDGVIEVIGVSFRNYEVGDKIDLYNEKLLNAILNISSFIREKKLPAELIEIKSEEDIHVYLGNIEVKMGNIKNMEIKLQTLNDVYPKIVELSGVLDLSDAKENMLDEQYIFKIDEKGKR